MDEITKVFDKIDIEDNVLYIIATPIGNLGDISIRALRILSLLDIILCEDTRITRKLLDRYNIKSKKLLTYNDQSNKKQREAIINKIKHSKNKFGLVSDAGTPLISDPGFKLVQECKQNMIKVTHLPGASSLTSSIILSGLPSHNFYFGGFLEKNIFKKQKQLENASNFTSIWYESSKRILKTIEIIHKLNKHTQISVLRELTKINEEVITGTANCIYQKLLKKKQIKGEIVIVLSKSEPIKYTSDMILKLIKTNNSKYSTKDLTTYISNKTGLPKKNIYNKIINYKSS